MQETTGELIDSPAVRSVIEELRAYDHVLALILFGSVARDRARPLSDIDLCIVTKKRVTGHEQMELLSYGSEKIDISLFQDLPVTIKFRVIREGKILFSKDTCALNAIKADTLREYLDIAPLIRKHSLHAIGTTG